MKIFKIIILNICLFLIQKQKIIILPIFDEPKVSIIIPVHNNFKYTYNCIFSILNANPIIPYEIIIINDMSIDKTKEIEKYIKNIVLINNKKINNFLLNCNNAVKNSRGKYILILNNDTKVHKEWLISLIKLIESDKTIGMVGSKLIYPNGILQEAGGIVWKNGECSNYGKGDDADKPEYNYVKEVDYISGASIIIRKNVWKQLGGFDTRFIPAYYEDTDFAFELRKHGYKVLYQPKSIVVHYEGISNGRKITSGIKQYQAVNKKKFIEKWEKELSFQKLQDNTFMARNRGNKKGLILVIDRYVPNFDKDAGSRCTYMYLKLFKDIGLGVTFLSDNFEKIEPYTSLLQQKGIEILYGEFYKKNIEEWLKKNLKSFTFVYLQRPDISIKYISLIKKYFSGKIFYFAHDLNYIRLNREYNITHKFDKLEQSKYYKKIEMDLFSQVDIIHVVGNYEEHILKNIFRNKIIRNIPLFIYETQLTNIEKDFSKRKDLIFVGGFSHSPNIDAVLWFAKDIYPKILKKYPEMIWHLVGSNVPDEIRKLESKNIIIEGCLSDYDLSLLYQKCRIAIVPLRFGAGVKGKIVEAAYNQIPIVTTSIGGEGLDKSIGAMIIEDNAEKISQIICNLYDDYIKLGKMSSSGKLLIEKYFSISKAKDILLMDLN